MLQSLESSNGSAFSTNPANKLITGSHSRRRPWKWGPTTTLAAFVLGYVAAYLQIKSAPSTEINSNATTSRLVAGATAQRETCLDPDGPQPYILMTLGRSGSGSTWQIIGNLTGRETPSEEYTGSGYKKSENFFQRNSGSDNDRWLVKYMCHKQLIYPEAGAVGFKWKPFVPLVYTPSAQAGLRFIATHRNPTIKVVRSRRNLLDVRISQQKHKRAKASKTKIQAHCLRGEEECLKKELAAGTGLTLSTENLTQQLRQLREEEDAVDEMLKRMNIPHVHVTYEKLYYSGDDTEEWMRIFRFLGVGPGKGLTRAVLEGAMEHVATHNPTQKITLENFAEVSEILEGTELQELLHR